MGVLRRSERYEQKCRSSFDRLSMLVLPALTELEYILDEFEELGAACECEHLALTVLLAQNL